MTAVLGLLAPVWARFAPYLIAVAIGGAVIVAAYQTGGRAERARGEARALRSQLATARADLAIANSLAEQADRDRQAEVTRRVAEEGRARDFEVELARRPAGACRWDRNDPRRLRDAAR